MDIARFILSILESDECVRAVLALPLQPVVATLSLDAWLSRTSLPPGIIIFSHQILVVREHFPRR